MWVRWEGERLGLVSLAPARGTKAEQALLPCAPELLIQLRKVSPVAAMSAHALFA
jgi:hypothetical protein